MKCQVKILDNSARDYIIKEIVTYAKLRDSDELKLYKKRYRSLKKLNIDLTKRCEYLIDFETKYFEMAKFYQKYFYI